VIAAVVSAVLQLYDVPPLAVIVALAPEQIVPSLLVVPDISVTAIIGVGNALTVITWVEVAVQPFELVTVTVYVVVVMGDLVMAEVSSPVFQLYDVPPLAVIVALAPVQMIPSLFIVPDVSATEIEGVGSGLTVIVVEVVAVQPSALVTVTVYVVVVIGETLPEAFVPSTLLQE
jgi:hypothetical protein